MIQLQISGEEPKSFSNEDCLSILNSIDNSFLSNGNHSLIKNNTSYEISVQNINKDEKTIELTINGKLCSVTIVDKMDLLLQKLGIGGTLSKKMNLLKAPMPGLVIDWFVKEGGVVAKGDKLLILEAMKMENVIKASGEGRVKKITAKTGVAVEKNQLLIEFE